MDEDTKHNVENLFGFKEGTLPIKYLGVPLISTRLTAGDSRPLIDKITKRKGLNLGLANGFPMRVDFSSSDQCCSVFRSTVYWSSIFILPKEVCKVIDQILRSFLWHGAVGISKAAKVAWDVVCLPREERGLGLKRVHDWNKAAITRHLWNIASNSHTIWTSWINSYLLKGRSVWGIPVPNDCSCGKKSLYLTFALLSPFPAARRLSPRFLSVNGREKVN
ncbi:hypothetical protein ACOSP7_004633 [Xanthoceras sorbifolium]